MHEQQEPEAADYTAATAGKHRAVSAGALLTFSSLFNSDPRRQERDCSGSYVYSFMGLLTLTHVLVRGSLRAQVSLCVCTFRVHPEVCFLW